MNSSMYFIQYTWDGSSYYILRGHRSNFPTKIEFLSLKIVLVYTPMKCFVMGLHCLPKVYEFPIFKVLSVLS